MVKKGVVTSKANNKCRVLIKDLNYETGLLDLAAQISYEELTIDDTVIVAFFDEQQIQGAVISKL